MLFPLFAFLGGGRSADSRQWRMSCPQNNKKPKGDKPMYEGRLVRLRAFDNSDLMQCLSYSNDYEVMRGASGAILYPSTVDDEARSMG